jgi:hypothetical protein
VCHMMFRLTIVAFREGITFMVWPRLMWALSAAISPRCDVSSWGEVVGITYVLLVNSGLIVRGV